MIHSLLDFLRSLTDPERLIQLLSTLLTGWFGYAVLFGLVFAETGMLVGFFLPGDSLLFTVGVVCGAGQLNIALVILLFICAALLGDTAGYLLGRGTGPHMFNRPDSRIFRREYLLRTHEFYEKHGGRTMIYAHFIPIIRTFAAFVAGVGRMNLVRFLCFDVFGVTGWVVFMTLAGYEFGSVGFVRHNFEKVVLGIIALSLLPAGIEVLKARRRTASSTSLTRP
ncbi:MAG TPA: VTT domain-containing protein [Bryobacteraceae bacterium]|jgi:membrane-associated protein|nr:VTT domain-containing protein [Bryobacteraceae bacterium]